MLHVEAHGFYLTHLAPAIVSFLPMVSTTTPLPEQNKQTLMQLPPRQSLNCRNSIYDVHPTHPSYLSIYIAPFLTHIQYFSPLKLHYHDNTAAPLLFPVSIPSRIAHAARTLVIRNSPSSQSRKFRNID